MALVVGPVARSEPGVAVVLDLERLRLVVEGKYAKHRSEDLLPCDRQGRVDVDENGGLHEIALVEARPCGSAATDCDTGAVAFCRADHAQDFVALHEVGDGPHLRCQVEREIGRAARRDRGCLYVSISLVAASLEKTIKKH